MGNWRKEDIKRSGGRLFPVSPSPLLWEPLQGGEAFYNYEKKKQIRNKVLFLVLSAFYGLEMTFETKIIRPDREGDGLRVGLWVERYGFELWPASGPLCAQTRQ